MPKAILLGIISLDFTKNYLREKSLTMDISNSCHKITKYVYFSPANFFMLRWKINMIVSRLVYEIFVKKTNKQTTETITGVLMVSTMLTNNTNHQLLTIKS